MTTMLTVVLAAIAFTLCSLREPTTDARTPAQMRDAARSAGWACCTGRVLLLAGVPALYVLAAACWMCWHTCRATGLIFLALAQQLDALTARPRLEESLA
ncbi:hypothetical protein OG589_14385 [Sphaerisporangium sp. NBC_01403]|uniref:hypothetical protein n=1 Tax=Sphaerisporangium sp. NBC_01403 TaxID=2903599 RepID=UPI003247DD23